MAQMRLLLYWIISAISLVISASIASRIGFDVTVNVDEPLKVLLGTAVLGLINATLGTVLRVLTAPIACFTFGLAWTIINALLFWLVGTWELGFTVGDFWAALVGSLLMGIVLGLLRRVLGPHES
jgi:putative membrane protein